jgi:hypothetical protein
MLGCPEPGRLWARIPEPLIPDPGYRWPPWRLPSRSGTGSPGDALAAMEVTELVVVDSPRAHSGRAGRWVTSLAERWHVRPPTV